MEYVTLSATQKNLSGTDFHASPEGVRRMDASNNPSQKTNKIGSLFFFAALMVYAAKRRLERQLIALGAEPGNDAGSDIRKIGVCAEWLARVHIR